MNGTSRRRFRILYGVLLLTGMLSYATVEAAPQGKLRDATKPLFDGKTLDGWIVKGKGKFSVEDGVIRCVSNSKSFLVTKKEYGDFVLEVETLIEAGGNSGIQFRSHARPNGKVFGYQAEIDTSPRAWAGGLYDEGRRGWLNPLRGHPKAQAAFKNGGWNKYRVACSGDWIRIWVNGVLTTDYRDSMDLTGFIGLQHHGEKGKVYRWRNIRILDLGKSIWKPLFDGKSLNGWSPNIPGQWTVDNGVLVGRTDGEPKHGLLFSEKKHGDFTARLKFKSIEGNSGFYFRVDKDDRPAACAGFQAEIDPARDVGGLYETYGRAWVVQPTPQAIKKFFLPGQWNAMTVSAHGRRIVVNVNGAKTAELLNDPGRLEGYFAFQLHGGQKMHVQFKDIEILEVPGHLDGKRGS